ncbi:MAG: type II toxin-antitoxin system VapC family toxin [Gemmataceae bacterium]
MISPRRYAGFSPRSSSQHAVRLRNLSRRGVHDLIAPSIFPAEAASALTKAERQKLIPVGQADLFLTDIFSTPPIIHPYEPLLRRAVTISSQSRSGLFDCLHVALAEREGCEVVTDDQKLIANLKSQFPFIVTLASLP